MTPLYFIDKKKAVQKLDISGEIIKITDDGFGVAVAACNSGHLWVIRKTGELSYSTDEKNWTDLNSKSLRFRKIDTTPQGNIIAMGNDQSLYGVEKNGRIMTLAPAGIYSDFSVGADGSLWFVISQVGDREHVLAFTNLQQLTPQPTHYGALGRKVAAGQNGQVGFITLGGEVASSSAFAMGSLSSDAGKNFAAEICLDSHSGTFFVLEASNQPKKKAAKIWYWNPVTDRHNDWKVLPGVEALSMSIA
ncbi:MAG: hypothetical protein KDC34_13695 [Saprospiraceae bacterium]|nr:hypothetical protein [Saprospiraceae bacterium]